MLVDGVDHHEAVKVMKSMTMARRELWDTRADFFNKMGAFAPTLGIIGTVLDLIHVLESLGGGAEELGHLIAAASNELLIEGHTDSRPIAGESDWDLSSRRAASVAEVLIGAGIDPQRLVVQGYADTRPVAEPAEESTEEPTRPRPQPIGNPLTAGSTGTSTKPASSSGGGGH